MAANNDHTGKCFTFTEARIAAVIRRVVDDGDATDADASGRRTWRDDGCRGLKLVVTLKTGTAVFYFVGKVDGKAVRRALGDVGVTTLAEAREAVNRLRYDRTVSALLTPRAADDAEPADDSPLVSAVVEDMLAAHAAGRWLPGNRSKPPTDRTMKFYRDLRAAQLKAHEAKTLRAFAAELPTVYADLQADAPVQANRLLQLCRNLYNYAASTGLWDAPSPVVTTGPNRLTCTPEQPRTRTLTDAEWNRLAAAFDADQPLWRDLFTMSLLTLQRMGAVCSMRWADLSLENNAAWLIPAVHMKGRRSGHIVPLAALPEALRILRARRAIVPQDCEFVFTAAKGDGEPARFYHQAWARIIRRAGLWHEDRLRRPRPHDLRRTGGARMTSAGVPVQTITRALGDAPSSVSMVARTYAQVADDALRQAFAATSKRQRGR